MIESGSPVISLVETTCIFASIAEVPVFFKVMTGLPGAAICMTDQVDDVGQEGSGSIMEVAVYLLKAAILFVQDATRGLPTLRSERSYGYPNQTKTKD